MRAHSYLCSRVHGEVPPGNLRGLVFLLLSTICASMTSCFLFPPALKYQAVLVPVAQQQQSVGAEAGEEHYVVQEDGSITYELAGLRLQVKPMTDDELNTMFADESSRGKYSVNPYTYGNWIDPRLGHTPNRFTVFKVTVNNRTFPKVRLAPLQATLRTDRGEFLHAYGITSSSPYGNFENYYRSLRGQSGNEFYRFELRMGFVRSHNYEEDQPIFKGENYEGFIVFDPVHSQTQTATLMLEKFTLRFGSSGQPLETKDLRFEFNHQVKRELVEDRVATGVVAEQLMVSERGPTRVLGNLPGDRTRDVSAIQAEVRQRLSALNRCFAEEFDEGAALEGQVVVGFIIEVVGSVSSASIIESTVGSAPVGVCMQAEALRWTFRPIDIAALQRSVQTGGSSVAGQPAGPLTTQQVRPLPVTVTYPFEFKVGAAPPETEP